MKNIKLIMTFLLTAIIIIAATSTALALDPGAYQVYSGTNYYNPDTGEIDDGGTANAALGEGMCRSATAEVALIEREGDQYFVTIRLLLQSNTNNVRFWQHTGAYNTYEPVNYSIMAENAAEDSIDYRFAVRDPFAPIKASMYVTPMGRDTVWYIELGSEPYADTGDFVVSVDTSAVAAEVAAEVEPEAVAAATEESPVEEAAAPLEEVALDSAEATAPVADIAEEDVATEATSEESAATEEETEEIPVAEEAVEEVATEEAAAEEETMEITDETSDEQAVAAIASTEEDNAEANTNASAEEVAAEEVAAEEPPTDDTTPEAEPADEESNSSLIIISITAVVIIAAIIIVVIRRRK